MTNETPKKFRKKDSVALTADGQHAADGMVIGLVNSLKITPNNAIIACSNVAITCLLQDSHGLPVNERLKRAREMVDSIKEILFMRIEDE